MMPTNNLNISTNIKASELPSFSCLFTQVFDIGYGQLCNYLEPEDIFTMFQVNKECAETVTEFLKNYKQLCMPLIASLIVKENHLKIEYNQDCSFQTEFSLDYPTYVTFYSEYERRAVEPSLEENESPRKIEYYLQIQQCGNDFEGPNLQLLSLDKGHYYSLLIQKINYKLKAIRENKTVEQPELWSDLLK